MKDNEFTKSRFILKRITNYYQRWRSL